MKFVYSDRYQFDLGGHPFRTEKYRLLKEELLRQGLANPSDFVEPPEPNRSILELVHTPEYLDDLEGLRWTPRTLHSELPLSREIVEGFYLMAMGSCLAFKIGLDEGCCVHIGGGFHHAFPNHAEGFCYINDIGVGLKKLLAENRIRRACVIDCDLHQGNGTARIFRHDERVFTFSIHQENLYPIKEQSDLDVGLEDGTTDEEYLSKLGRALPEVLSKSPELCVYVAGADPYEEDMLGGLRLTKQGLLSRDELVVEECRSRGIPLAVVLAGGYAPRVEDTVKIHLQTCRVCKEKEGRWELKGSLKRGLSW